ncbi:MAG: hypothetical protein ACREK6_03645 [Candidatus Rokuibacteriota bacterium]
MLRRVFGVVVLALLIVGILPADAQSPPAPRVWTQVSGAVESIEATRLTLKTDQGARLRVDISSMSVADRNHLVRGRRVSLIGYVSPQSGEFMAWFSPGEEPTGQASPPTTPPAAPPTTPAPIPVPSK